jgi:hypothetical protein
VIDSDQIDNDDQESLLRGQITVEQLLLAANVLSAQNPQGPDFNRKKLLEDAHELALEAREAAFMTTFTENFHRNEWLRLFAKFGYNRREQLEFVPYEQAACEITGLSTAKQATARFERFIKGNSDLMEVQGLIKWHGVWKDLIEEWRRRENESFKIRTKWQNRKNASQSRSVRKKKSKKILDSL